MGPLRTAASASQPRGFWRSVIDFLTNPVTWKGMGYLLLKLPLGMLTFVVTVFLCALSGSFLRRGSRHLSRSERRPGLDRGRCRVQQMHTRTPR